ncbi:MAG: sigma-70 family RNA polymerase sigma factor [Candidatus Paceibacterota bacterium]
MSSSIEFNDRNQDLFRRRAAIKKRIESSKESIAEYYINKDKKKPAKKVNKSKVSKKNAKLKIDNEEALVNSFDIEYAEWDLKSAERELDSIDTEIIQANYGLVLNYVRKFTSTTNREDSRDFEGAAVLGLMRAIHSYDPDRGSKFSTWAYKPIQRECLKAVRDADYKHLNPGDFEKRPDILAAVKQLQNGNDEFVPAFVDVAKLSGATVDTVRRVINTPRQESLSKPINDDGKSYLGDVIPDSDPNVDDAVIAAQELSDLEQFGLSSLDDRELFVISRRFGLDSEPPQRLSAIGSILGLSREAVRQVESKALSKLNHPVVRRKLIRHGRG